MDNTFKTENILVSVVITAYNDQNTILRAVSSIQQQDYHPIEIVIVDDGSTDATREIIEQNYSSQDIVKIFQSNGGLGSARSAGSLASSGEFLSFLDADDTLKKDKIRKQVRSFDGLSNCVIFTGAEIVNEDGFKSYRHSHGGLKKVTDDYANGRSFPAANASMMLRKADYLRWGGFDAVMRKQCEEDFLIRIFSSGGELFLFEEALYRIYLNQCSNRWIQKGRLECLKILYGRGNQLIYVQENIQRSDLILKRLKNYMTAITYIFLANAAFWPWDMRKEFAKIVITKKFISKKPKVLALVSLFIPTPVYRIFRVIVKKIYMFLKSLQ